MGRCGGGSEIGRSSPVEQFGDFKQTKLDGKRSSHLITLRVKINDRIFLRLAYEYVVSSENRK